jgi:pyruvate dehydrogenase E2 component (dihydrolipoamide acetyltransferase)
MGDDMTIGTEQPQGVATKLTGIRRTAAGRMIQAWQAPMFHLAVDVAMTTAMATRTAVKGSTVTDVLLLACAWALPAHPGINAHYAEEVVTSFDTVNLGVAVATDAGLVVPVIHGADGKDLAGLARARRELTGRARDGRLGMADVTGGTFTVSNLGMMGIDRFDAILNVPQVAILAVGATRQRPVPGEGGPCSAAAAAYHSRCAWSSSLSSGTVTWPQGNRATGCCVISSGKAAAKVRM